MGLLDDFTKWVRDRIPGRAELSSRGKSIDADLGCSSAPYVLDASAVTGDTRSRLQHRERHKKIE